MCFYIVNDKDLSSAFAMKFIQYSYTIFLVNLFIMLALHCIFLAYAVCHVLIYATLMDQFMILLHSSYIFEAAL